MERRARYVRPAGGSGVLLRHPASRFEVRRDMSNQPSLLKGALPVKAQITVTGGLVYVFDMREAK